MSSGFETVIGLEIHSQLLTHSKIFCFAPAEFGASENTKVGPVSAGLPGALPVLNKKAVELAIRAGLALNCSIKERSQFSRKNYFYPDLPKGYQISQFDLPICENGYVDIKLENSQKKRIHIERIHMEEDAGKSTHLANLSLVNLNRSGVPLIEIVSKPDMRSASEAVAYLKKIHQILVFSHVTDGNMEEGNFRCDVNVSVRPIGQDKFGTRTEIKNINSFRFVEKALEYEVARQIAVLQTGGKIIQETRGWDSAAGKSYSLRSKEDAHDYRYFPDPDLPPLVLSSSLIEGIKKDSPELPDTMKNRYIESFGLSEYDAEQLTSDIEWSEFFEKMISEKAPPKQAANWILGELLGALKNIENTSLRNSPIKAKALSELILLIENKTISGKIAKSVFQEMLSSGKSPDTIVKEKGLVQVLNTQEISAWSEKVILENPSVVEEYRAGKEKVFAFLVGQVMKLSKGKANPDLVTQELKRLLNEPQ